jgi:hypothetical protein
VKLGKLTPENRRIRGKYMIKILMNTLKFDRVKIVEKRSKITAHTGRLKP